MQKKIIVGNWKMNPLTEKEAIRLFSFVLKNISKVKKTEVVVCPPSIYLANLKKIGRKINFGVQDAFWGDKGAFTGEISSAMAYNMGAKYAILGHSERRSEGETNEIVNKKIKGALAAGLKPIVCVGETMRDSSHNYFNAVKTQLSECLEGVKKDLLHKVIIAYEPVWAISSTRDRKDATPTDSLEMAIFIRKVLSDKFGGEVSKVKIIYGGSVNEKDAEFFLKEGGVDGLLAGRASLDGEKFSKIVRICEASQK